MFVQLNCIIVDVDTANRQEMVNFLTAHGVDVVAALSSLDQLAATLAQGTPPRLVLVNIDASPQEMLQQIAPLARQYPATSFFVMSQVVEASLVMEAMHVGAKDFVTLPVNEEKFLASIERVAQAEGLDRRGKVITVIPTIGGCGATTIACNVAAALARNGRTLLLDLDLVRGAVANNFDLRPRYSVADVMDLSTDLDKALIDNATATHRQTGLAILARPEVPEDSQRVSRQGLGRLLGVVSRLFDYVIIDSMMSLDPVYVTAMNSADVNVLVMQLNVPSAKNTERFLGAMRRLGIDSGRTHVVVNRCAKKAWDIEPADVERSLGLKISWTVPNDYKNAIAAINYGEPVVLRAPRAEISDSLQGLMQLLNGKTART